MYLKRVPMKADPQESEKEEISAGREVSKDRANLGEDCERCET